MQITHLSRQLLKLPQLFIFTHAAIIITSKKYSRQSHNELQLLLFFSSSLRGAPLLLSSCLSLLFFLQSASCFLKSSLKRGFFQLKAKLSLAYCRLDKQEELTYPAPVYSLFMNKMVPKTMVRTFQLEVQDYLWQLVNVVHIDLLTSNLPLGVKNSSCGGEKGQSSVSWSNPWQKPPQYGPSKPWMQK